MHLLILGLILVVSILVYYIMTTSNPAGHDKKKEPPRSKVSDNLRKEDNVIFLPTADGNAGEGQDTGDGTDSDQNGDAD